MAKTSFAGYKINIDINHRSMLTKVKRGAINIITAPIEIPKQIKGELKTAEGKPAPAKVVTLLGGTVKGLIWTIGRVGSGLYDVLTFNINLPNDYEPLMKPDYVCERKTSDDDAADDAAEE